MITDATKILYHGHGLQGISHQSEVGSAVEFPLKVVEFADGSAVGRSHPVATLAVLPRCEIASDRLAGALDDCRPAQDLQIATIAVTVSLADTFRHIHAVFQELVLDGRHWTWREHAVE